MELVQTDLDVGLMFCGVCGVELVVGRLKMRDGLWMRRIKIFFPLQSLQCGHSSCKRVCVFVCVCVCMFLHVYKIVHLYVRKMDML